MKNLTLKVIISVYICLISLAFYNAFHTYRNNINQAKETAEAKLSTVSRILAQSIDADLHQSITNKFRLKDDIDHIDADANYKAIHQILAKTKESSKISSPIYTLFLSRDKKKVYFGVTSSDAPYYRHAYETPPKKLFQNFNNGDFIDEYEDENGIWLSYFSPIKNSKGETVAVVQADQNFNEFMKDVNIKLLEDLIVVVLIYTVIGILLFLFLQNVLKKEEYFIDSQKNYSVKLEEDVNKRTKELNILNAKLKAVNNELSSFFYSTSHDIRGPLCRILGLSSLAKHEDDKQELVELIEVESQKMDNMLKKMILVNNLRTKSIEVSEISVSKLINHSLQHLNKKYNKTKAEITINTETQSLNQFNSDKEILECIAFNLLDNAFKFSDAKNPKISITTLIDKNGVLNLSVTNNGDCFTENERRNAFELFKNADKKSDTEGIKLGLYTIKTAVDKLNGIVDIIDNNNCAEVRVLIPDYHKIENLDFNQINSFQNNAYIV